MEDLDDFPYVGNVIIPTHCYIVQRGRYTTNKLSKQLIWEHSEIGWKIDKPEYVESLNPIEDGCEKDEENSRKKS